MSLRPECPKITWHHERKHLEDFLELGWKKNMQILLKQPLGNTKNLFGITYIKTETNGVNRNWWMRICIIKNIFGKKVILDYNIK